ncbi:nitroreductase [Chitinasiproducens palmae]|uniref:Nitroreductase n=1 Tax=Chitinasiproducens palmae TaxID=1770053 RepID=A0A1H2PLP8_9BURK|nr:nitroreductase [Chitinasiproducens palmae]SDV47370.1 Nitroreductase [Chitinasiproducens palmae]
MPRHPSPNALAALLERQSIRAFQPEQVSRHTIEQILDAARYAPSGTNTQPWHVIVVSGAAKTRLCEHVAQVRRAEPEREAGANVAGEYRYYSDPMTEPYLSRRRRVGWDMYRSLGIAKGDRAASRDAAGRNYRFFDAPVGLIFTLERVLEKGSWIDLGIFLQSVMIAARHYGLDTCAQGAWARYHDIVRKELAIPDGHVVVCGMALGYADMHAPVNTIRAQREPLDTFARFVDQPLATKGSTVA